MPLFAHLGQRDVDAIIAYLRSFATLPNRSAVVWDLYRPRIDPLHCVGCALCLAADVV